MLKKKINNNYTAVYGRLGSEPRYTYLGIARSEEEINEIRYEYVDVYQSKISFIFGIATPEQIYTEKKKAWANLCSVLIGLYNIQR
jgi:hypothetical protein